jgi:hypothetical protein
MTTLLPIFAHSALIGPIDSKQSANERESGYFFVQTAASSLSEQLRQ